VVCLKMILRRNDGKKITKNEELKRSSIPPLNPTLDQISRFALTFNGYDHWGSFEACADIANKFLRAFAENGSIPEDVTLTELRTCLFFEQRRWHHLGELPDEKAIGYLNYLIGKIRERVDQNKLL
jgi:hypothetical protein